MKIRRKTIFNLLLFAFILSFFVTPLGNYAKVTLNRIFSSPPTVIEKSNRHEIALYDWKLKDENWDFINFDRSRGNVIFVNFWASWKIPSEAELISIQKLYSRYGNKIDFYIITDEERPPVEKFIKKNNFNFPVTYLIIGEKSAVEVIEPPGSYVIDKSGKIVMKEVDIADWDSEIVTSTLDQLIK